MYWMLPLVESLSLTSTPPLSSVVTFESRLFGMMPWIWSDETERRAFARSVPADAAMFDVIVWPVAKKSFTLSGCAIHGVAVQLPVPAPGLSNWQMSRPSSLGPQL